MANKKIYDMYPYQASLGALPERCILRVTQRGIDYDYWVEGWDGVRFIHRIVTCDDESLEIVTAGKGERIAINSVENSTMEQNGEVRDYPEALKIYLQYFSKTSDAECRILANLDALMAIQKDCFRILTVLEYTQEINE